MKPFYVLIVVFVGSLFITRFTTGDYLHFLSARIAMAAMLGFTALGHFLYTKGMVMMVPKIIPFKKAVVYISGVLEILFAVGLLIPQYMLISAWLLIIFLIVTIPGNIKAAMDHVDYQKATHHGPGPKYLWFRIPLQFFFIMWVVWSCFLH